MRIHDTSAAHPRQKYKGQSQISATEIDDYYLMYFLTILNTNKRYIAEYCLEAQWLTLLSGGPGSLSSYPTRDNICMEFGILSRHIGRISDHVLISGGPGKEGATVLV